MCKPSANIIDRHLLNGFCQSVQELALGSGLKFAQDAGMCKTFAPAGSINPIARAE
jgi:hypothetical protein